MDGLKLQALKFKRKKQNKIKLKQNRYKIKLKKYFNKIRIILFNKNKSKINRLNY